MTTTFQSREAVRDELVTAFTNKGSWQAVYGYFPAAEDMIGVSPVLIIRSRGTQQDMAGQFTNPAIYRFLLSSWVLAFSDNWTTANAEDKLDDLDRDMRQVIRDNVGLTNADTIQFEPGMSQVDDVVVEGTPYIVETRAVLVTLARGAI